MDSDRLLTLSWWTLTGFQVGRVEKLDLRRDGGILVRVSRCATVLVPTLLLVMFTSVSTMSMMIDTARVR